MSINITSQLTIGELKQQFAGTYPHLRLAFYRPHQSLSFIMLHQELPSHKLLESFRREGMPGRFDINASDKVRTLEQRFREEYQLEVQVIRYSGSNWIMTTTTDEYTLTEQEQLGKEMATEVEQDVPQDIHEQE